MHPVATFPSCGLEDDMDELLLELEADDVE